MWMFCAGGEGGDGLAMRSGMLRECFVLGRRSPKKKGGGGGGWRFVWCEGPRC